MEKDRKKNWSERRTIKTTRTKKSHKFNWTSSKNAVFYNIFIRSVRFAMPLVPPVSNQSHVRSVNVSPRHRHSIDQNCMYTLHGPQSIEFEFLKTYFLSKRFCVAANLNSKWIAHLKANIGVIKHFRTFTCQIWWTKKNNRKRKM